MADDERTVFLSNVEDSRRWDAVELRDGDVIVCTPPKCGTTWTQQIVASLLHPIDGEQGARSWPDFRLGPVDEMLAALASEPGRRVVKSHCPLTALPTFPGVRHVLVYRDPADALVSWGNHRAAMVPRVMAALNEVAAADGLSPLPERIERVDHETLFDEWAHFWSPARHVDASFPRLHDPTVAVVHYADLYNDLPGRMRDLADFLDIAIDDALFPAQVERCRLADMREAARERGDAQAFDGGPDAFYFEGGLGRGRRELSDPILDRVDTHVRELVGTEWAAWLSAGGPATPLR